MKSITKSKVTMKDIAKRLNISQNTVSLALRNIPTVKRETRDEVIRIADEMGYVYGNGGAPVGLSSLTEKVQTQHNICIFTDSSYLSTFYFYTALKVMLENRLTNLGYGLIVESMFNPCMTMEQLRTFCEINSVEGIIVLGDMDFGNIHLVLELGMPVVTSGFYFQNKFTDCIMEENISAMHSAIRTLYDRGYRKIGFLGNTLLGVGQRERYLGYYSAMQTMNMETRQEWVLTDCASDTETLYHDLKHYFGSGQEFAEVFLCGCDQMALCAMEAAQDLGLNIPREIGFVGFDNIDATLGAGPKLTTMDPHNAEQADLIVSVLMDRIHGDKAPLRRQIVAVSWVEGDSVWAAK